MKKDVTLRRMMRPVFRTRFGEALAGDSMEVLKHVAPESVEVKSQIVCKCSGLIGQAA